MGNTAYTGHALTVCGCHQVLGFEGSAKALINLHGIEPWNARSLIKDNLVKQGELARRSPLRFVPVEEGLKFMKAKTSGWFQSGLTKEQFVQSCCLLLGKLQIPYQPSDRDDLHLVFDSMDFDKNESLSVGEWAAGLSVFFKGNTEEAVHAVFDTLDKDARCAISKKELKDYLAPFVKAMSPASAAALRPLLEAKAVDDIYNEMDMDHDSLITSNEMIAWTKKGNSIVDKLADIIDKEVYEVWLRENQKRRKQQGLDGTLDGSFGTASPGSWGSPQSYPQAPAGQLPGSPGGYRQGQDGYAPNQSYGPGIGNGPSQYGPNQANSGPASANDRGYLPQGQSPNAFGQANSPSQSSVGGWLKGLFGGSNDPPNAPNPNTADRDGFAADRNGGYQRGYDGPGGYGGYGGGRGFEGNPPDGRGGYGPDGPPYGGTGAGGRSGPDAGYSSGANASGNGCYDNQGGYGAGRSPERRPPQQRDPFAEDPHWNSVPAPPPPPARGGGTRGPPSSSFAGVPAPPSYANADYGGGYGPPPRSSAPYGSGGYGR